MTMQKIIAKIKEVNINSSIKWSVLENTSEKVVLTNDYDKGINYLIRVRRDDIGELIIVRDNLLNNNVGFFLKGDDYEETEQGLLKGVAVAVHNFNYYY